MPDWSPPPALDTAAGGIRGALGGTRLFDRPEHAEKRATIEAFLARPAQLGVEIGFDHGMKTLGHARRWPEHLWIYILFPTPTDNPRHLLLSRRWSTSRHRRSRRTGCSTSRPT